MPVEWASSPPDLLVTIDRGRSEPLGRQLQEALREAVRTGRIAPGERLPSTRDLAAQLGVSRGLVTGCFEQLAAEGYLTARAGSRARVAPGAVDAAASPPEPPASRERAPELLADFVAGVPCLPSFPTRDWLWALTAASSALPTSFSGYGDPAGPARAAGGGRRLPPTSACRPRRRCRPRRLRRLHPGPGFGSRGFGGTGSAGGGGRGPRSPRDPCAGGTCRNAGCPGCRRRWRDGPRRARRVGCAGSRPDTSPPVTHRRSALRGPTPRARGLGACRRGLPHRGRLRRRVPLRPPARGGTARARPRPRHPHRVGEQTPGTNYPARLGRLPARPHPRRRP